MAEKIIVWPAAVLPPASSPFNQRPFTRSGGRTLGGIQRAQKSDRGYWVGSYQSILFRKGRLEQRRVWNALRTALAGMSGLVAIPVCATSLLVGGGVTSFALGEVPHDDDVGFDDDAFYSQGPVTVKMGAYAPLGSTVVSLRPVYGVTNVAGIRFSYQHAMYETGPVIGEENDGVIQVSVFPAIRREIAEGVYLEVDRPTCLCHLASDSEMDIEFPVAGGARPSVNFVEAVDYWNRLAAGG